MVIAVSVTSIDRLPRSRLDRLPWGHRGSTPKVLTPVARDQHERAGRAHAHGMTESGGGRLRTHRGDHGVDPPQRRSTNPRLPPPKSLARPADDDRYVVRHLV